MQLKFQHTLFPETTKRLERAKHSLNISMNNMLLRIQTWFLLQKINVKLYGGKACISSHMARCKKKIFWILREMKFSLLIFVEKYRPISRLNTILKSFVPGNSYFLVTYILLIVTWIILLGIVVLR